jgi:dihydrolipoamide dehydrogenase
MSAEKIYDLIVVGGGPAGYAAAIRAGQLGKSVACIEVERAGGTCLNWGCIPSKALLKSAELYRDIQHAEDFGFTCSGVKVDFAKVISRSRGVADQMAKGIEFLLKKNKVDYITGRAQITAPGKVAITEGSSKGKSYTTKNILISTGCKARSLPDLKPDGEKIMTSREALVMKQLPKSIVILGAGAIGAEFAYFLNAFGSKVTLVEMLPQILPVEDREVGAALARSFKKQGIDCRVDTKAENIKVLKDGVKLDLVKAGKAESITADSLLVAIGVVPNTDGLLAGNLQLEMFKNYIKVDDSYQTSVKGIYAAGDIIGPPWLAHVATYEAIQAVNGIFGASKPKRVSLFPGCTYCQPQVASIGMTEEAVKEKGIPYKVGKFPFSASGKAVASNHSEGFVKLIVSEKHEEILGAHIIGSDATEMIAEYALGMALEATAEDIHHTIHAHPTLSEAMMEAAASVFGEAIHI